MAAGWRVAALGFVVGATAGGVAGFQMGRRPDPAASAATSPTDASSPLPPAPPGERVERAVLLHPWWRGAMTQEGIDRLAQLAHDTPSSDAILIHRDGTAEARPTGEAPAPSDAFWLRLDSARRPNRPEVLAALRAELDRAEYRDPR